MSKQESFFDRFLSRANQTVVLVAGIVGIAVSLGLYQVTHNGGSDDPDDDKEVVTPVPDPDDTKVPTCYDGMRNGKETGVDCGGNCPPCPPPLPTCSDKIRNGNEEGVDCGGNCPPCEPKGAFTNLERIIEESTGRLTKTSGGKNWNGGASSVKVLPAGTAGGVSYTLKSSDGHFLFGLSPIAGDAGFQSVKYALAVQPGTGAKVQVNVFESGINRTKLDSGTGARISIHRAANGKITYAVDGVGVTDIPESNYTGSLLLDLSINHGGVSGLTLEGGWR